MRAAALPVTGAGVARGALATRGLMSPLETLAQMKAASMKDAARRAESCFYVVVAAANELASVAVFDAMQTLRRNNFHGCKEARKWASQCQRQIDGYEVRMKMTLKDASRKLGLSGQGRDKYTLWLDLTDHVDEELRPHITRLYYAIKLVMDREKTPHSETLARMWLANIMLQLAVRQFNEMFERQRKECMGVLSLRKAFTDGCMDGQLKCWDKATEAMCAHLCPKDERHVALDEDWNISNGIKAIANRLKDPETYNRGADYAIGLNLSIVDEETRQEYQERKEAGEG